MLNEWHLSGILSVVLVLMLLYIKFGSSYHYVDLPAGEGIPPDPGRWRNNSTLLGIDSDGDGVRDDVQRYIIRYYDGERRSTMLLKYFAGRIQNILALPSEGKQVARFLQDDERKMSCVLYLAYSDDFDSYATHLDAVARRLVVNTYARRGNYNSKFNLVSGSIFIGTPSREINDKSCKQWYGLERIKDDE